MIFFLIFANPTMHNKDTNGTRIFCAGACASISQVNDDHLDNVIQL